MRTNHSQLSNQAKTEQLQGYFQGKTGQIASHSLIATPNYE